MKQPELKLTKEERAAVRRLVNLSLAWPQSFYLSVSVAGTHIMRTGENGEQEIVVTVDIPNDLNR